MRRRTCALPPRPPCSGVVAAHARHRHRACPDVWHRCHGTSTPNPSACARPSTPRRVFEKLGARVVVDGASLELLDGATVDFKDEMAKSAFVVSENPMSGASCGCGTSFTAKDLF